MFTITKALKQHMVDNFDLSADADNDAISLAVEKALEDGKLTFKEVKELSTDKAAKVRDEVRGMIAEEISKSFGGLKSELAELIGAKGGDGAETKPATDKAATPSEPKPSESKGAKLYGEAGTNGGDGDDADSYSVRVKSVVEQFNGTTTAASYDLSTKQANRDWMKGRRLESNGASGSGIASRSIDMPSDRTKAIAGAWFKRMICNSFAAAGRPIPRQYRMTELDEKLCEFAAHESKFVGPIGFTESGDGGDASEWVGNVKLTDLQRKALLDDGTSGGLEAVPIEFDDVAIITPLLEGELFPLVDVQTVTRRRIEGFSIGNPTLAWNVAEGSSIALFTTTSFIAAFDTTIYPVAGSMEIGLDFLADSPVDIGNIILQRYGAAFRKELDDVIANGQDGSAQPEGVFQASGTATVNSDNGSTGPATVNDYESLLFGVAKEYRANRARGVFIGTETSYQRARAIPVDASNDQRRIFGMDHESFELLGHPYKINEDITNADVGYFQMDYYRFYRRAGFGVRVVTEDQDLARKNLQMIVVRARVGGQLELGGAGAVSSDMQS